MKTVVMAGNDRNFWLVKLPVADSEVELELCFCGFYILGVKHVSLGGIYS